MRTHWCQLKLLSLEASSDSLHRLLCVVVSTEGSSKTLHVTTEMRWEDLLVQVDQELLVGE